MYTGIGLDHDIGVKHAIWLIGFKKVQNDDF